MIYAKDIEFDIKEFPDLYSGGKGLKFEALVRVVSQAELGAEQRHDDRAIPEIKRRMAARILQTIYGDFLNDLYEIRMAMYSSNYDKIRKLWEEFDARIREQQEL
jgi:hypothetical protein